MKLNLFNSIVFKVSLIYTILAIINIAFFTTIIFENQVDLITDNSKLQAEKIVNSTISALKKFSYEFGTGKIFQVQRERKIIWKIDTILRPLVKDYIIYLETGEIVMTSNPDITLPGTYMQDTMKAMANKDFTGNTYYLRINEKSYRMYFYIPLYDYSIKGKILFISFDMHNIGDRLEELYSQSIIILIITTFFHIVFALLFYRVIIKPIQQLRSGSKKITSGDLSTRVLIEREDELGSLGKAFNTMADSIEDKMDTLEKHMDIVTKAKNQIEKLAITDELTGLYNRRHLFDRLTSEISRANRKGESLSFILIDIDHFKNFNDTYGHQVGDIVLYEVAQIVKQCSREMDIVARYGGEEIAIILPECHLANLAEISERIRTSIENNKVESNRGELSVTVSLGATCFNKILLETLGNTEMIIYFADIALYRAKAKGRNRVEIG